MLLTSASTVWAMASAMVFASIPLWGGTASASSNCPSGSWASGWTTYSCASKYQMSGNYKALEGGAGVGMTANANGGYSVSGSGGSSVTYHYATYLHVQAELYPWDMSNHYNCYGSIGPGGKRCYSVSTTTPTYGSYVKPTGYGVGVGATATMAPMYGGSSYNGFLYLK